MRRNTNPRRRGLRTSWRRWRARASSWDRHGSIRENEGKTPGARYAHGLLGGMGQACDETFGSLWVTPSHDRSPPRTVSQLKTVTLVVAFRRVQCWCVLTPGPACTWLSSANNACSSLYRPSPHPDLTISHDRRRDYQPAHDTATHRRAHGTGAGRRETVTERHASHESYARSPRSIIRNPPTFKKPSRRRFAKRWWMLSRIRRMSRRERH
jgi:hypothetical protein